MGYPEYPLRVSRKKQQMAVTLKRWLTAGETIDRRARAYAKRHGVSYKDAINAVRRNDKRLRNRYHRPVRRSRSRITDRLEGLAEFLNSNPKDLLYQALWSLKHPHATVLNANKGWSFLAPRLLQSQVRYERLRAGVIGVTYPADSYGIIAQAIQEGVFATLRCCRWQDCDKFFVSSDRRRWYCSDDCLRAYNTSRMRKWRERKKRE
jgi:hypothetical protein